MSRWTRNAGLVLMPALLLSVALLGCSGEKKKGGGDGKKGGDDTKKDSGEGVAGEMKAVKVGKGTISGVVKLGKEDPPYKELEDDLKKKIDANKNKTACEEAKKQTLWIVDKGTRGVKNVAVWIMPEKDSEFFDVKELAEKMKPEQKVVVLDQPHCHFEPRVVVLFPGYIDPAKPMVDESENYIPTGQKFYAVNPASIEHNTKFLARARGAGQDVSQLVPKSTTKNPEKGLDLTALSKVRPTTKGAIGIACDIHNWMEGAAWALPHPLATTTNEKGEFKIENVPDSGKVRIFVWHEFAKFVNKGGQGGEVIDVKDAKQDFTIDKVN